MPMSGANSEVRRHVVDIFADLPGFSDPTTLYLSWRNPMNVHLKIKIMSLAAEAQIIRSQTRKMLKWARRAQDAQKKALAYERFSSTDLHRKLIVRKECRAANLAYGFLRGRGYRQMETKSYEDPLWEKVLGMIERFGEGDKRDLRQRFSEWKDAV